MPWPAPGSPLTHNQVGGEACHPDPPHNPPPAARRSAAIAARIAIWADWAPPGGKLGGERRCRRQPPSPIPPDEARPAGQAHFPLHIIERLKADAMRRRLTVPVGQRGASAARRPPSPPLHGAMACRICC
jgi:hypothetical protein